MKTAAKLGLAAGAAGKVYFSESFDNMDAWTQSTWKGDGMGQFSLSNGKYNTGSNADSSLATKDDAKFYGTSATFPKFNNKGKKLVLQYQVKYDKDIECGGGYLKLGAKMEDQTKFGDPTSYNIMFGPDKCGYNKRTHLIFNYKGKNVLKRADLPYKQDVEGVSNLYRLVLDTDNSVKVYVDRTEIYSGTLDDWDLLPTKQINDPEDLKPDDWVDEALIEDPEETKPEDWVDEKQIVDAEATKPEDWDEEEDGEWTAPMKDNPAYKGPWSPKRISNPAYKGVWTPKQIDNPEYEAVEDLYAVLGDDQAGEYGFVGFDLWQVKAGSHFDNLIITDDESEADSWAERWTALVKTEKEQKSAEAKSTATEPSTEPDDDDDDDDADL